MKRRSKARTNQGNRNNSSKRSKRTDWTNSVAPIVSASGSNTGDNWNNWEPPTPLIAVGIFGAVGVAIAIGLLYFGSPFSAPAIWLGATTIAPTTSAASVFSGNSPLVPAGIALAILFALLILFIFMSRRRPRVSKPHPMSPKERLQAFGDAVTRMLTKKLQTPELDETALKYAVYQNYDKTKPIMEKFYTDTAFRDKIVKTYQEHLPKP